MGWLLVWVTAIVTSRVVLGLVENKDQGASRLVLEDEEKSIRNTDLWILHKPPTTADSHVIQ